MNPFHTVPGGITIPAHGPVDEALAIGSRLIADLADQRDALEAQLERYRNIITALEAELAETTDQLTAGDTEWRRTTALLADKSLNYLSERDRADIAQATAEALLTEVAELRAKVAKLLELNAEGRPWQITPKADA